VFEGRKPISDSGRGRQRPAPGWRRVFSHLVGLDSRSSERERLIDRQWPGVRGELWKSVQAHDWERDPINGCARGAVDRESRRGEDRRTVVFGWEWMQLEFG